jgi:hypothetical protein
VAARSVHSEPGSYRGADDRESQDHAAEEPRRRPGPTSRRRRDVPGLAYVNRAVLASDDEAGVKDPGTPLRRNLGRSDHGVPGIALLVEHAHDELCSHSPI